MNTIGGNIRKQYLLKIKQIIDADDRKNTFSIVETYKNKAFMREYNLALEDVKNIIRGLSVEDCFSGPERDRDPRYEGWIFKFKPMYDGTKLYIKIRIENMEKTVCISVHEFGLYDEED